MLRKPLSLLSTNLVDEVYAQARTFYSADDALRGLVAAQDQFRAAVASGAFPAEKVRAVLHELDDLRECHVAATLRTFQSFQTVAFMALERAMEPGFQDEFIDLTAETQTAGLRRYPTYRYARLDLNRERLEPNRRGDLALFVGENPAEYAGPGVQAGRQPSQCRGHYFVGTQVLPQTWAWTHAGV